MYVIAFVWACLVCASYGRRVHTTPETPRERGDVPLVSQSLDEFQFHRHSKRALERFLLTLNPGAGWQASGVWHGHGLSTEHPGHVHIRPRILHKNVPLRADPRSLMLNKQAPGTASVAARRLTVARRAIAVGSILALVAAAIQGVPPAWAATAVETEHLHLGQKIAQSFRGLGLSDELVIMLISALPAVELRGGVPVGAWLDMPALKVLGLCVLGNMLPIYPLIFALKFGPVQKLLKPVLDRAQRKAESAFADPKSRALLLAAFVGIPLPGTGAWTGAMGAFLLGMPTSTAMAAIFGGVVASGLIMTALAKGGTFGIITGVFLLGTMLTQVKFGGNGAAEEPSK